MKQQMKPTDNKYFSDDANRYSMTIDNVLITVTLHVLENIGEPVAMKGLLTYAFNLSESIPTSKIIIKFV